MKIIAIFAVLLLAESSYSNPIAANSDILTVDKEFFDDNLAIYTAQNDIIRILVPLNALNFDETDEDDGNEDESYYIFFVEGEANSAGFPVSKGLSVLKNKTATKLLENGRDAAASSDDSKQVFLGASDGIYVFNQKENKAEKYGTLTDDIYAIEKANGTDVIYILTADHSVYKVTEEGTVKEKLDKIKDAYQIALDFAGNLFYADLQKHVYVYTTQGDVVRIKGIAENPSDVMLIRPPIVYEEGIPIVVGKKVYSVYTNGTSEFASVVFDAKPSASSIEPAILQYHAYQKKIYEYNFLAILLTEFANALKELKEFLEDKTEAIQDFATRSRSTFRA